ncbi:hypothetical protein DUNSADRAFT_4561 [Dunaliella salina]|uniref:Uncharacterized protein n=1 Tax=Dunaliella salina TaxID=3046 RepID=A0ABQ7GRR1_DUNSA|nr:hypothetical protein DUNSADRAFT_4561 [Dunaliella salina]|eukprot:KAF5837298.1 hypothetical protein DUNSADRAFT_4561 [Dunaliella salina]
MVEVECLCRMGQRMLKVFTCMCNKNIGEGDYVHLPACLPNSMSKLSWCVHRRSCTWCLCCHIATCVVRAALHTFRAACLPANL